MVRRLKERIQPVLVQDYDGVWEAFVADHGGEDPAAFVRHLAEWDLIPAGLASELLAELASPDDANEATTIMDAATEVDEDAATRQWNREEILDEDDAILEDPTPPPDGEERPRGIRVVTEPGVEIDPEAETLHIDRSLLTPAPATREVGPPPPAAPSRPPSIDPRGGSAPLAPSAIPPGRTPSLAPRAHTPRPADPAATPALATRADAPARNRAEGTPAPPPRRAPDAATSEIDPSAPLAPPASAPRLGVEPRSGVDARGSAPPVIDPQGGASRPDAEDVVRVVPDPTLGRRLLVRSLPDEALEDAYLVERFDTDLAFTAQLDHPGIPAVIEPRGRHAYAIRCYDGRPLSSVVAEVRASFEARRPVPASLEPVVLLERFARVCEIVAYAHSRGVVHRDLNPNNVLLGHHGEAWVVGWGQARVFDRGVADPVDVPEPDEDSRTLTGTPGYCSPEQANGRNRDLDARSDVYALGLLLFELLTLRPAVTGASPSVRLMRQQHAEVDPVAHFYRQRIDRPYHTILATALAVHPADRYASPASLAEDLRRAIRGAPLSGRKENLDQHVGRFLGRHPAAVALVIVTLITAWATTFALLAAQLTGQIAR